MAEKATAGAVEPAMHRIRETRGAGFWRRTTWRPHRADWAPIARWPDGELQGCFYSGCIETRTVRFNDRLPRQTGRQRRELGPIA